MLNFDYKKRLNLNELSKKIDDTKKYKNDEYSLQYMINEKIKDKEQFSSFEINDFLKQISAKKMIIQNYISINEIIPANILYFNKKYYL